MKKVIKISIIVLSILFLLPIAKNIYLYLNYNHFNNILLKTPEYNQALIGKWNGKFDILSQEWNDTKMVLTIYFYKDSTGLIIFEEFPFRINNSVADFYSWSSLLPYDESKNYISKYKLFLKKNYFYYIYRQAPNENDSSKHKYTEYKIYKISGDSLYTTWIDADDINSLPKTELNYSYFDKHKESDLLDWDLINPYIEYKKLFKEIF